ncbi:putative nuclease HARBI1, partial [Tanacetum coccineum]
MNSDNLFFDDTNDEAEVNSLVFNFFKDASLLIQASTFTIRRNPRNHIVRDHHSAHDRLVKAYFAEEPLYDDYFFCKRFRMRRPLFTRIVRDLTDNCLFFQQGYDVVGKASISTLVKCTKWSWAQYPTAYRAQFSRGSNNDINVLRQSPVLNDLKVGKAPEVPFVANDPGSNDTKRIRHKQVHEQQEKMWNER